MTDQLPRLTRTTPAPKVGIVHLGPGAFFRAFLAPFTQDALAGSDGDWGITAVSLRSPTARDQLVPQGGVYTSVTRAACGDAMQVIDVISDVLVAPDDPDAVIAAMAAPEVKIVSLTITEKGYCLNGRTRALDLDHPDIRHDLTQASPRSAPGFIFAALAARRRAGVAPFTLLSCDNLPANGVLARNAVLAFAQAKAPELAVWLDTHLSARSTMVDRITPATTDEDIARLGERTGYHDPACVVHEAFRQWVIEDDFPTGRPSWEHAGAQCVHAVARHEEMKLRCLNGTHSALAYLGYLAGHETISDTVADTNFAAYCTHLWTQEIVPTLDPPEGENLSAYCESLLARYRETAIRHRTWQIAMDGSQKLPQRILATITDRLAAGVVPQGLCLAVAGWMRYVRGVDEQGSAIDVRDPLADALRVAANDTQPVDAVLAMTEVFPDDLARNTAFRDAVVFWHASLARDGARATLRQILPVT